MKKSETSTSWGEFLKELEVKCKERETSLSDTVEWIRASIEQIEKKAFDYYISFGPTPKFPDLNLDINILLRNFVHGFSIYKAKREYSIYAIKSFYHYKEEISGDFLSAYFYFGGFMQSFLIEDKLTNSTRLRKFARQILNGVWET